MTEANPLQGFSPRKKELLELIKRRPGISLTEVAQALAISKVAALRHLRNLEERELVSRDLVPGGRGRPRVRFRLREASQGLFSQDYGEMSRCALRFVEERLGRPAVIELLRERTREIYRKEAGTFVENDLSQRVARLVRLRDRMGYMAEIERPRAGSPPALLEHNCPILTLAKEYGEACEVERQLFENLLGARVEAQHRVAAGDPVCRFLVRPRGGP